MENKEIEISQKIEEDFEEVVEEPKYVDRSTLNLPEKCIALIMYKPKSTLLIAFIFAVAFIAMGHILTIILGLFILAFALFVQVKIGDYPTLEIYPDFVLIYKLDSNSLVRQVYYEDVEEWENLNNEGKTNCIFFQLKNGERIYKDTFQSSKAYKELKKLMQEKESREIQHRKMIEKNKKVKMKFKLPFKWPFGNKK